MIDNKNLKEKDIYKLFNEIKIEESEFKDIGIEINDIQKQKIKNNLNKRINRKKKFKTLKYGSSAAALAVICLIGVGAASPSFAKGIPVLGSIIQTINNQFGDHGDYADYSQVINKSVENNGITFTINEVIADDSKMIIGYTIKSDKKLKDLELVGLGRFIKINGKHFGSSGSSAGRYIDDYTYIGSEEIRTTIPQNSKRFNIDLNIHEISNVKGQWNFAFGASKEEICKKSVAFKVNKKIDFPDSVVTVDKVEFSPIDTYIFINGKNKYEKQNSHLFDYDYWIAFDDKGKELIPKSLGGGEGNLKEKVFSSEMNYEKLKDIPKYLTIVPCKITPSGGGGVSVDKNGKETPIIVQTKKPKEISKVIDGIYPIELPQGKMGKLIIEEIKTENNQTVVKYRAEGKAPYFQAQDLLIKDDKGNTLEIKDYNIRDEQQNSNEFIKKFEPLNPNKKYTIYTNDFSNVEFREDLKFKIEFKK